MAKELSGERQPIPFDEAVKVVLTAKPKNKKKAERESSLPPNLRLKGESRANEPIPSDSH